MTWHVSGTNKRIILTLTIDYDNPIWPPLTTMEYGIWTFSLSDVYSSQIN